MKLSVALTTFNGERFIKTQLQSIFQQSRPPDELLVCDDGSTDSTLTVLEKMDPPAICNVRIFRNQTRLGYSANFQQAVSYCTGDVIFLADQDDVWHTNKLEVCVNAFQRFPNASLVVHSGSVVDCALNPTGINHPAISRNRVITPGGLRPFVEFPGFSLAFSRTVIDLPEQVCNTFRLVPAAHDGLITLIAGSTGETVLLSEPLVSYRQHGVNTAGSLARKTAGRAWHGRISSALQAHPVEEFQASADKAWLYVSALQALGAHRRSLPDDFASAGIHSAASKYSRYARAMERRAETFRCVSRSDRARSTLHNALYGDYCRRSRGALGVASLARDCVGLVRKT